MSELEKNNNYKNGDVIRLALPKGRMKDGVISLMYDAGIKLRQSDRGYRPTLSLPGFEAKFLKPQNILEMLDMGSRDIGFGGADWVAELGADVVELLDTGMDGVSMVVAAPASLLVNGKLPSRRLVVASEYQTLAARWIQGSGIDAKFVRSFGATEVFPPEDADIIVDITSTGSTLRANKLVVTDELMTSSTRLYASRAAMDDPKKRERIERLVLILRSVLEARKRVMIEVNVSEDRLEELIGLLPCMRQPTLSPLSGGEGYAVKAAIPRELLAQIVPEIKKRGGTDVVVTRIAQIVP